MRKIAMKHKDRTRNLDLFADICGYLSRGIGRHNDALLSEAKTLVGILPAGTETTRYAIISGEIELVKMVIDLHQSQCLESVNALTTDKFWNEFDQYSLRGDIITQTIPLLEAVGANMDKFRASFVKFARKAVLQDQPSFLECLINQCDPKEEDVNQLLWESAVILNAGTGCAPILEKLVMDRSLNRSSWKSFFQSSMTKGHHKSALVALKVGALKSEDLPIGQVASNQDVIGMKARNRFAYFLGSSHRRLHLFSIIPDMRVLLGMSAGAVGQMLDERLKIEEPAAG
jgi:hypothetical protein